MDAAESFRQKSEHRKHRRQALHYPALILLRDQQPCMCMLSDVSDGGAKITITTDRDLPDEFVLMLSGRGGTRRHCRVVWRGDTSIGVEFQRRPMPEDHAEGDPPAA
jgi:hypothetical protein